MNNVLDWISGISWTLVYLFAIYRGIQKKSYCIPAACICLNFSWEMWTVLVRVIEGSPLNGGFISQILWLVLDIGVLYTWLRCGKTATFKKFLLLIGALIVMATATLGAGLWAESAFIINLIMSLAFLFQLDRQVLPFLPIAILKCLGTLPATILNGIIYRNLFILAIGGLCLIADLYYIYEIAKIMEHHNLRFENGVKS